MKRPRRVAALLLLATCANGPVDTLAPPAPEGSAVGLGQRVAVGRLVATPLAVLTDSRCPADAICIWAGELVLSTRIDGEGWSETAPLTLGVPRRVGDTSIRLVTAQPLPPVPTLVVPEADYRFTFAGGT